MMTMMNMTIQIKKDVLKHPLPFIYVYNIDFRNKLDYIVKSG